MIVGVVSDTHGRMHPGVLDALDGCERIVHAGDVGDAAILVRLASIAPLTAVRGNVDRDGRQASLPATGVLVCEGRSLYVIHDLADLDVDPAARGMAAVISGHSHVPKIEWRQDVLYLNPGSCGPRRFRHPITLARLAIEGGTLSAELITLEP